MPNSAFGVPSLYKRMRGQSTYTLPMPQLEQGAQGRVQFVDSHTAGEPTRVVVSGFPALPGDTLAQKRESLSREFDQWRSLVNNEPRGNDVLVSALLVEPTIPDCAAGVIFFNNVGPLGMCGHGTIGLVTTLAYLGRIGVGDHRIDTPVGVVTATLHEDGRVSVHNVPSYRSRKDVSLLVPDVGEVRGDIAYGGNWFFLTNADDLQVNLNQVEGLMDRAWRIRQALDDQGITGDDGAEIDHIELFAKVDGVSRSFVLCPGKAYDRSPCGTGTSARMAQLHARGELPLDTDFVNESFIGSRFTGRLLETTEVGGLPAVVPTITGRAWVTGTAQYMIDPTDPYPEGFVL